MGALYHEIIYRPIFNLLVFYYNTIGFHDLGIAIILVTITIRLLLYPFFHKGAKHQMLMQRIQPKVKEIQERHKGDREKQTEEIMALYKEHGVNPMSGFLLLLIQLPVLIALYRIFLSGVTPAAFGDLYSFIAAPGTVNATLLGVLDLTAQNIFLVVLVGLAQYAQARLAIYRRPDKQALSAAEKMAQRMALLGPVITVAIFYRFPAAVSLYWLASSLFSVGQQALVNKHLEKTHGA